MRVFVNKHFFNYRYDYREEWLRFLHTISESEMARGLPERVIQAVADIVDSPGGLLWQRDDTGQFVRTARWTSKVETVGTVDGDSPFLRLMEERNWIVDLTALAEDQDVYERYPIPDWILAEKKFWLVIPLLHHRELAGFIVLEHSRAPRSLNWEDRDLLKTVSQQAASYLAEQKAEKALAEARQFEEFNKKFAFIMHDIKNLASQLSLMVKNADKHVGNPEFQKDMVATVRNSVDKMHLLLTRLNRLQEADNSRERRSVPVKSVLERVVQEKSGANANLTFKCEADDPVVRADPEQLETIFTHIVQNALDAIDKNGAVDVILGGRGEWVSVCIADTGPGMDETFVREELFKPFRTTKAHGYGIGAYESQQLVRGLGGRIEVDSALGRGTSITVWLPRDRESRDDGVENDTATV